jgi:hypothetical protein
MKQLAAQDIGYLMGIGNGRHRSWTTARRRNAGAEHGTLDMNVGIHKRDRNIGIIPVASL